MKKITGLLLVILLVLSLAGCNSLSALGNATGTTSSTGNTTSSGSTISSSGTSSTDTSKTTITATNTTASASTDDSDYFTDEDYNTSTDGGIEISLNGTSASASSYNVKVDGSTVTIEKSGTYIISGTLEDGQIIVDEADEGTVHIILNGVSVSSTTNSAIYIKQSTKTIITLADGTSNNLSDATSYTYDDTEKQEPSACIFSKDDLTINGSGSLSVTGNFADGIKSKDSLAITGGTININSKDDGITGKDYLAISGGSITISSSGDALKATNDTDEGKGVIYITGGEFNITSAGDALDSVNTIIVTGGEFNIETGGGSSVAKTSTSAKGIKAGILIEISDGTFNINSSDDALHSNGTITINGGDFTISTSDDAVHADSTLNISEGTLNISKCCEGLESQKITISGGNISLVSSDDGINGSSGSSTGTTGGEMNNDTNVLVTISGGTVYVNAAGDGLDSNGSVVMTGGSVVIDGPTEQNNGAIDYNGTFEISGGTLIAGGSTGMAQTPSSDSTINSIIVATSAAAGSTVTLTDSNGNTIMSYTPNKTAACIVFSSADIKTGSTYSVSVNGTSAGQATISAAVTTIGNVSTGGMGGGMGGNQNGGFAGNKRA
jgi:hypothetical protein